MTWAIQALISLEYLHHSFTFIGMWQEDKWQRYEITCGWGLITSQVQLSVWHHQGCNVPRDTINDCISCRVGKLHLPLQGLWSAKYSQKSWHWPLTLPPLPKCPPTCQGLKPAFRRTASSDRDTKTKKLSYLMKGAGYLRLFPQPRHSHQADVRSLSEIRRSTPFFRWMLAENISD